MINDITDKLKTAITAFLTANYSGTADVASGTNLVFALPDFKADDESSYAPLVGVANYCFVIADPQVVNDIDAPHNGLKLRYSATVYVVRKTERAYDEATRKNRATQGDSSPLVTSLHAVATNLAKYLRANTLTSCYWNDITATEPYGSQGQFRYIPCTFEALRMESSTIS